MRTHCKKGAAALLGFIFALPLALTGCTTVSCAGSAVPAGPILAFTAKDWASAHPDTELTVCFGSECSTISTGAKYSPVGVVVSGDGRRYDGREKHLPHPKHGNAHAGALQTEPMRMRNCHPSRPGPLRRRLTHRSRGLTAATSGCAREMPG